MGLVVEKTPSGAFALVLVIGILPVFTIVKSHVAEVPIGTLPNARDGGSCRCAAPETAVAFTGTVSEPRLVVTTNWSVTGGAVVGPAATETGTEVRGWMTWPTAGTVAGSTLRDALAGRVTPVTVATLRP